MPRPTQIESAVSKANGVQKKKKRRKKTVPREDEIKQLKTALEKLKKKYAETNDAEFDLDDKQFEVNYEKIVKIRQKQDECERRLRYLQNEAGEESTEIFVNCTGFEPLNEKLSEFLNNPANLNRPLSKKIFSRILNEVKEVHGEELMIRNRIPVNSPDDLLIFSMIQMQNIARQTKLLRVHVPMLKRYDPEGSYDQFISAAVNSICKENENGEEVRDALKQAAEVMEEEGDNCSLDDEEEGGKDLEVDGNFEVGDLEEFMAKVVDEGEDDDHELMLVDSDDNEKNADDEVNVADDFNNDSNQYITLDSDDDHICGEVPSSSHEIVDTMMNGQITSENVKRPQMASSVYPQKGTVVEIKEGGPLSLSHSNFMQNSDMAFGKIKRCATPRPDAVPVITLSDDDDA
ncbi:unnamed protein product [Bursaphelenchus xylophilus]|uniref:(pine wood nematode) hypothetical protein n=1 Tax=Bursaphelenchus xylophilus TaxID=6326 RepID=A0A1I7S326_BURXY|nr:unnamed protein product [Bursaphelenchus xylophilus]CAG9116073.1 unnamed protein product [Bursaphelenchus xylophilus]